MSHREEKILNATEALRHLSSLLQHPISRMALYRWLKSGRLGGRKVAGRWYTSSEAISRFIRPDDR